MIGVAHDYDQLKTAPEATAAAEVTCHFARGDQKANGLASSDVASNLMTESAAHPKAPQDPTQP
jgi:hypothetical protein